MPTFTNEKERHDWIVKHADFFTVVRLKNLQYERYEVNTLKDARKLASHLAIWVPEKPWMIYACTDDMDTFVEAVK